MSPKQAICYNLLSATLSLVGMLIGIVVGNIESASSWIFALIGGIFLYVALVDMVKKIHTTLVIFKLSSSCLHDLDYSFLQLPELTSVDPRSGEHPLVHFLLQNAGMLLGFTIMFIIAFFEEDISFQV